MSQNQLANMCGVTSKREISRLFCRAGRDKYWQCVPGARGSLLFYTPEENVPSDDEIADAKEEKRKAKDAERKRLTRDRKEPETATVKVAERRQEGEDPPAPKRKERKQALPELALVMSGTNGNEEGNS